MRRPLLAALTSLAVVVGTTLGGSAAAAAPPADPAAPGIGIAGPVEGSDKVAPSLGEADGQVTAFVQLAAPSALDVAESGAAPAAVAAAAETITALADEVVPGEATARSAGAAAPQRIAVTTNLLAGTLVSGDAARVRALADSADVVAVYRIVAKTPDNKGSDAFTRAQEAWTSSGATGEGVRLGVIDTGLDYTHADFGGPGTPDAYGTAYGADGTADVPAGTFDPTKYLGGYDFAGPNYDADPASTTPGATLVPTPDANPIDAYYTGGSSGHGSHVAGTAGGFGQTGDGATFRGDYATLTDLTGWQQGPGSAPEAGLFGLKVFGDNGGSTDLVINALEWAADPNGDLDFSDHLDVLNLSLGSASTPADDPENLFVDRLTDLGVLSVMSAGNSGDLTDVGGSPGNSRSALTVANSVGNTQTYDAVEITAAAEPALVTSYPAQNSSSYAGTADVTAPVVALGTTVSGCTSLAASADALAGKIAYLWWDDNDVTRECGSGTRFNNAQAAGAVGVLIGSELPVFNAGIAGNATLPGAQLTAAATDALLAAITAGGVSAHVGPSLAGRSFVQDDTLGDTLNASSSRGVHGSLGVIKPDVAAPGTAISSTAAGTGNRVHTLSGTSMASPHVAGIAALVRGAHPTWTPVQVKASIMNTATHDVFRDQGPTGPVYGPARTGSGRVDAADAVTNTVLAYATDDADLVSVTFGVVPVGDTTVVQRKAVTVQNTGTAPVTYATSFATATTAGGATLTTSPASITVKAGGSAEVTVTLTADPATLAKDLDPTSAASYDLGIPIPRDFLATVSGRLILTSPTDELRVPVSAAPKLVSDLTAQPVGFASVAADTAPLTLTGRGVDAGGWLSLMAPMQLAATSPELAASTVETSPSSVDAGDVRYVGFSSTAPQLAAAGADPAGGTIGIGIATQGDWANLGTAVVPIIDTDVDGDGTPDLQTVVQKYSAEVDFTTAQTYSAATGELLEEVPVNGVFADVDTTVFDSNVLVVPMSLALGFTPGVAATFSVWTYSGYAPDPSGLLDQVEPFSVDPYAPAYWFDGGEPGSLWFVGAPGTPVTVHRSLAPGATAPQLLVLSSHNATPQTRAQVVAVTAPVPLATTTRLTVGGGKRVGADLRLSATVEPRAATGTVRFLDGATELGSTRARRGTAQLTVSLGGGEHTLTAQFTPDAAQWLGSTSAPVTVAVAPSSSSTELRLSRDSGAFGRAVTANVTVRGGTAAPSGPVSIQENGAEIASGELVVNRRTGKVTIDLPRDLAVGRHVLTAVFAGTADVAGSSSRASYRVEKATARVSLATQTWTVPRGSTPAVIVTVASEQGAPTPTGTVTVLVNGQRIASEPVAANGTLTVTLPKVTGTRLVTALYGGDAGYRPQTETRTLRTK
ncbi:S8 family serine peptidase [Pengzhenrongella frigida]|uniref:Peptidase S8 n=1 Tax=Pengzhenrongella frigida TaxID=1259133 RepID=A0A4Q5N0H3_9MICO|nr:S8 family serine peptidase [Cellulomonas sp. HLT2-17]RYV51539.1 peptidase S8 [Cellulomonas sp. HLT2-17]